MTDVISLELHVCGRTNSLRVGRTTHSKKRLACETAIEMNGKKRKMKNFGQMKEFLFLA